MYCSRCGTPLPPGAAYCPNCGTAAPLAAPAATTPVAAPAPVAATPVAAPAPGLAPIPADQAPYAGFWRRFWALALDSVLLNLLLFPIAMLLSAPLVPHLSSDEVTTAIAAVVLSAYLGIALVGALVTWLYFALMESSVKQATLGKLALGIRVTDLDGGRIGFGRATGRHFGKLLSGLTFLIGYIIQAFTARRQALHDLIASTLVVRRS